MELHASPSTFSTLRRFGLNDYQARAYLALLRIGKSEAKDVAEAADVPTTRIHGILSELEAAGWLEVERTRPQQYVARTPGERLPRAWRDARSEYEDARRELDALARGHTGDRPKEGVGMLRGEAAVREHLERALKAAREEIVVSLPFLLPRIDPVAVAPRLEDAARRGLRVRLLVSPAVLPELAVGPEWEAVLDAGAQARLASLPARFLVADYRVGMMVLPPTNEEAEPRALWDPLEPFVQLTRPAFEAFWRDAVPIAEAAAARHK